MQRVPAWLRWRARETAASRTGRNWPISDIRDVIGIAFALVRRGFGRSSPVVELILDHGLELSRAWQHTAGVLG